MKLTKHNNFSIKQYAKNALKDWLNRKDFHPQTTCRTASHNSSLCKVFCLENFNAVLHLQLVPVYPEKFSSVLW